MAEVFLGMQEGVGGFEKLVVIKRIFEDFGNNEDFVAMFLDEARLAASVQHHNVVQVIDIGKDPEGYFMVMEYLAGESCAFLFDSLQEQNSVVPPHIACRIGADIATGLHRAHTATDAAGKPQPLVHRDVTPSNLIVCFDGTVKIVDFGVAKATLADGRTQAGSLKGKMSYLAPEQVEDLHVDGRADVFQLGICLHEMLTGQRLFSGGSDHDKMLAVLEKPIPAPSNLARGIPLELDNVVMAALERNPDKRFQSADEFRHRLEGALSVMGEKVSPRELGFWMKNTFAARFSERTQLERECVAEMRNGHGKRAGSVVTPFPESQLESSASKSNNWANKPFSGMPPARRQIAESYHRSYSRSSRNNATFSRDHGVLLALVLFTCLSAVAGGLWYLARVTPHQRAQVVAETQTPKPTQELKEIRLGNELLPKASRARVETEPARRVTRKIRSRERQQTRKRR